MSIPNIGSNETPLGLPNSGFFGFISSSALSTGSTFVLNDVTRPVYLDTLLNAGGPATGPNNPLFPDYTCMPGSVCVVNGPMPQGPSSSCNFPWISCNFWADVGAVAGVITTAGHISYTYGGYLDPSGANAYTYEPKNGS